MAQYIFTSILMVALSAMLYLMARALPRIVEDPQADKPGIFDRWARSQFPEKVDTALNGFLLKTLRKFKVIVLKLDNTLSAHLQRAATDENGKKSAIDFKEIAGQNKGSEI